MAMVNHARETTDNSEFAVHFSNYRAFLHVLWSAVAVIALTLILLAIFFG